MQCYALGALELFDDIYDIEQVSMTIYQPRRQNVSTYEISKDDLYRWADEVLKPTADLAFAGDGNFLCGEWCGFCKAKNECRARAEANLKLAQHDFKLPPLLTDTEIEVILGKVDELVSWASDIKEYALQQALSGKEWTGFKLVEGRSNRRYSNEAAVIDAVEKAGFDPYEKKLLGITAMQKLLGNLHRPGSSYRAACGLLPLGRTGLRNRRLHHHCGRYAPGDRLQARLAHFCIHVIDSPDSEQVELRDGKPDLYTPE